LDIQLHCHAADQESLMQALAIAQPHRSREPTIPITQEGSVALLKVAKAFTHLSDESIGFC
jgi:hypothetical protein